MTQKYDFIIIGAGIVGLTIADSLKRNRPDAKILLLEKEDDVAAHASGRNSGVLHAGFYYTADSLKAKFTVQGNRTMREYCAKKGLPINECGKLVVAQNAEELTKLNELFARGQKNGSTVRLIDESEASAIEPNVKTHKKALYSPLTATVDSLQICKSLRDDLRASGVDFQFKAEYLSHQNNTLETTRGEFEAGHIINASGLYADRIAHDFGFGKKYTMIPFKGLYLEYTKNTTDIRTNIYPVPNLKNPFLGVHFTKTVTGKIKIGPTATPALWRENYNGFSRFKFLELLSVASYEAKLFLTNAFGFRDLAFEEVKKYNREYFINLAARLVKNIDPKGFGGFTKPGIRAQLLDTQKLSLVQDFVVEGDGQSTHVLNAVSPAFTCAFPFSQHVVANFIFKK